jgi:hypothetical protein
VAASRLDVIRRALDEVWTTQGARFATFEVGATGADADLWVQYLDGELNVRWPLAGAPAVEFALRGVVLPAGAFVEWWAPGENAVVAVGALRVDEVAALVDSLLANVLAARADFPLNVRVDDHS